MFNTHFSHVYSNLICISILLAMPRGRHRTKVIQLNRINGNFGLKLVGGSGLKVPPSVAELQPGGAAEFSQKV